MSQEKASNGTPIHDKILDILQAEGIDTIFGIPDPGIQAVHHAAIKRGMKVIAPHHEQAGAFMADAMSRLTGNIQVVVGNQGPGVANLLPAAVCASKEKIPVLFLAEQRTRFLDTAVRRAKFQYTPQPRFFEAGMKYVGIIEHAEHVEDIFHEAFRHALTGEPGPVYIEYPQNLVGSVLDQTKTKKPEEYRVVSQAAEASLIDKAAQMIADAKFPIVLSGTGVQICRGADHVKNLAKLTKLPVIPTWGGRGVLPETDDQVFLWAAPTGDAIIEKSDLVIAIGTGIGEALHFGRGAAWSKGNPDRKWIYVEKDPTNIGVNRQIDVPLVGDLRAIVPQLIAALKTKRGNWNRHPEVDRIAKAQQAFRLGLIESAPDTHPIHPGRMIVEATKSVPDDAVIVRDGGATGLWESVYHVMKGRDFLWTSNFGHLGTGLPYAIGAQLAVEDRRRVCLITGDSAFMFHISELETAVRKNLPVVCIVNSDSAWGLEHPGFESQFGRDQDVEVRWGSVRMDTIAEGFGAHGEYCTRTEEISAAVDRAFDSGKPAVVQIAVDPRENAFGAPMFKEFASVYGDFY